MQLEFTIDSQLNIMELNASKKIKDHVIVLLLTGSQIAKTHFCNEAVEDLKFILHIFLYSL